MAASETSASAGRNPRCCDFRRRDHVFVTVSLLHSRWNLPYIGTPTPSSHPDTPFSPPTPASRRSPGFGDGYVSFLRPRTCEKYVLGLRENSHTLKKEDGKQGCPSAQDTRIVIPETQEHGRWHAVSWHAEGTARVVTVRDLEMQAASRIRCVGGLGPVASALETRELLSAGRRES